MIGRPAPVRVSQQPDVRSQGAPRDAVELVVASEDPRKLAPVGLYDDRVVPVR